MTVSQNKIIKFKPITDKEEIKNIWNRYDIHLDFEKDVIFILFIKRNKNFRSFFDQNSIM